MPRRSAAQDFVLERQQAYRQVFQGPYGELVLADLAKFCRAHESTFHESPQAMAFQEGRREVWLRIQEHMNLDAEQLWQLFGAAGPTPQNSGED